MAVEDHPLYEKWSEAVDRLKIANDSYREAKKSGSDTLISAAKKQLGQAQTGYDLISKQLD